MIEFRPGQRLYIPGVRVMQPRTAGTGALLANLISFWSLEEASGQRNDSHGTNHLTDNNTVTQAVGKVGNAAQFTAANSEYLSIASNAMLQTGNIDFTFCAWAYLDTKGANRLILSKAANGMNDEYLMFFHNGDDRFEFWVQFFSVPTKAVANLFGAPSTGTWYFVVGWHDATGDTVNIQINNGGINSTATAGQTPTTSTNAFLLGAYALSAITPHNGRIDQVGFWKRILTADERTFLYNSGNGRSYAEISAY